MSGSAELEQHRRRVHPVLDRLHRVCCASSATYHSPSSQACPCYQVSGVLVKEHHKPELIMFHRSIRVLARGIHNNFTTFPFLVRAGGRTKRDKVDFLPQCGGWKHSCRGMPGNNARTARLVLVKAAMMFLAMQCLRGFVTVARTEWCWFRVVSNDQPPLSRFGIRSGLELCCAKHQRQWSHHHCRLEAYGQASPDLECWHTLI